MLLRLLFLFTTCLLSLFSVAQTVVYPYKIKGHLDGVGNGKVYVYFYDKGRSGDLRIDSTDTVNGDFVFSSVVAEPVMAYLLAKSEYYSPGSTNFKKQPRLQFFIENGYNINIDGRYGSLDKAKVSGGMINADYARYLNAIQIVNNQLEVLVDKMKLADANQMKELQEEQKRINNKLLEQTERFIKQNPGDMLSVWLAGNILKERITAQEECYNVLMPEIKQTSWGKKLGTQVSANKTQKNGVKAPDFVRKGIDGKDIYLSGYRGKYVVLTFWSSWCAPCRTDNSQLKAMYDTYKDKGVEFISVSLDKDLDQWLQAVRADKLNWPQINAFYKDKDGKIAVSYNVKALPTQVLIDPNGIIVDRFTETQKLRNKLLTVLK
ncbi:TlpA disulfide reductase family protein [Solitalea canadensis]|uniref:Peroxiredoxin n=1 Tax=Solitalea canadensis (strain ATCC 29591 / DSM 3403 / JCM 21819 / LMG 8368 / NBRC 15130 / NCIMB 12057 / USAM 9D) TaxID=929556 RepID=H8KRF9_SOLCM|nr:TlpA disulfide reductase family protein [Solitalea canadensis]AFD07484.1 Peroxiredoxin [Solitalea canadensis DSM 3403]